MDCSKSGRSWETLAAEAQYRPGALAKLSAVSIRTLQRQFLRHTGFTLGEWLRQRRLQLAYDRIKDGEQVKSVAYGLGFKQLSHFSREFKRQYEVPPSQLSHHTASRWASFTPALSNANRSSIRVAA